MRNQLACSLENFGGRACAVTIFSLMIISTNAAAADPLQSVMNQLHCRAELRYEGKTLQPEAGSAFRIVGYNSVGFLPDKTMSVAWCQQDNEAFILFFTKSGRLHHPTCQPYVRWPFVPRGLRLFDKPDDLAIFGTLDSIFVSAPESETASLQIVENRSKGMTTGMSVVDGDRDTLAISFYCHNGDWLMQTFH